MKTETVNYQAKNIDLKGYVAFPDVDNAPSVSYTHLTLPTICSV